MISMKSKYKITKFYIDSADNYRVYFTVSKVIFNGGDCCSSVEYLHLSKLLAEEGKSEMLWRCPSSFFKMTSVGRYMLVVDEK